MSLAKRIIYLYKTHELHASFRYVELKTALQHDTFIPQCSSQPAEEQCSSNFGLTVSLECYLLHHLQNFTFCLLPCLLIPTFHKDSSMRQIVMHGQKDSVILQGDKTDNHHIT